MGIISVPTPQLERGSEIIHRHPLEAHVTSRQRHSRWNCDASGMVSRHLQGAAGEGVPEALQGICPGWLGSGQAGTCWCFSKGWRRQGPADPSTAALSFHVCCHNINTIGNISGLEEQEKQTQGSQTECAKANFHVTSRNHMFIKPPADLQLSGEVQCYCV